MKNITLPILAFLLIFSANGQENEDKKRANNPVPLEVLIGNQRLWNQVLMNQKLKGTKDVGLFNLSSYAIDYTGENTNIEFSTTTALYYNFIKGFSANAGLNANAGNGLNPFVGLQYIHARKTFLLIYLPSFYYTREQKLSNFALLEFKPKLNENWSIYSRVQAAYSYNLVQNTHARSSLNSRLGLTYKIVSFGAGANFDWYGSNKIYKENYGLFLRITL